MDHEPMRRVAEFREVFDGAAGAERPELAEHRRTLLVEVHRSNLSELDADGRMLKGPDYRPPLLGDLVTRPSTGS
ncbi:hypothetical protein [Streptomyces hainanensis]|uniref:Uncharacterized protein n=1 Tax=Streptomyces hainanensis TaxID=402648 RepID=A0A4R4T947_9ACTN|nr:hypothetical protein [Streptomyces hainanensis]TDC71233.1 hypothetical protein E1283_23800 [Streptomyces hainanensis]